MFSVTIWWDRTKGVRALVYTIRGLQCIVILVTLLVIDIPHVVITVAVIKRLKYMK
jgi:hypothetical protein